jgi:hypothetical protein
MKTKKAKIKKKNTKICIHCEAKKATRPRGLCWTCYYTPDILAYYPIVSKYAVGGFGQSINGKQDDKPTHARPGSEEKILILQSRAKRNKMLFHPLDARL